MDIDLNRVRLEHFKSYALIRRVAEQGLKREKTINSKLLAEWTNIIDKAIAGERLAIGLKYLDLNAGIEELIKMGYIVTDNVEDEVIRTRLDSGELKITSEMLKDFYKKISYENPTS